MSHFTPFAGAAPSVPCVRGVDSSRGVRASSGVAGALLEMASEGELFSTCGLGGFFCCAVASDPNIAQHKTRFSENCFIDNSCFRDKTRRCLKSRRGRNRNDCNAHFRSERRSPGKWPFYWESEHDVWQIKGA